MSHYRDGTHAHVGDLVRGVPYNRHGREIVGTVMQVTPGSESCNLVVAFVTPVEFPAAIDPALAYEFFSKAKVSTLAVSGSKHFVLAGDYDYGETKAFDLIARAPRLEPIV